MVIGWALLGWFLELDTSAYLLAGIPIILLFQLVVRRQPLRSLWVRDAPPFKLTVKGKLLAGAFAVAPALGLLGTLFQKSNGFDVIYFFAGLVGAAAAAYAFSHIRREHLGLLLICVVINEVIDAGGWFALVKLGKWSVTGRSWAARAGLIGANTLAYLPLFFMVDEVAFRGAFDAHLSRGLTRRWWFSALYVSALWALWHTPIYRPSDVGDIIALAIICPFGVVLSYLWRKTGNLAMPVFSHALSDGLYQAIFN